MVFSFHAVGGEDAYQDVVEVVEAFINETF